MVKKLTPGEQIVGRRCPPLPRHIDTVMASFVGKDGGRASLFRPSERWLGPAFLAARRKGWLRQTKLGFSCMGSKAEFLWTTTDSGHEEALAAAARVAVCMEARNQWSRDWTAAWKASR